MKIIMTILTLSLLGFAGLDNDNDLPNREAFKLKLAVDSTQVYEADIAAGPYMLPENTLQLYPGEILFVEVEVKKGKVKSMKTVKAIVYPEKTMTISFRQSADGPVHSGMSLKVVNPFDNKLKYDALIYLMTQNRWVNTSIMPVYPKLSGYEMWQDVIVTIALSGWTLE